MTVEKRDVPPELLDSLLADYQKPEDLIGANGLLKQLTKLLVERALDAELTEHLGHGRHQPVANAVGIGAFCVIGPEAHVQLSTALRRAPGSAEE